MKNVLLVTMCAVLSFAIFGCGGGGGGDLSPAANPPPNKFAGSYSGTFTVVKTDGTNAVSPHFGTWRMNISVNGAVSGHTNNDLADGSFGGTVDSDTGRFTVDQNSLPGFPVSLDGTVAIDGTVAGVWTDPSAAAINFDNDNGKFTGTKKTITTNFVANSNGTVTDTGSGLTWLKNADCFGPLAWDGATAQATSLASGSCGLTDGSTAGQWRLPTRDELQAFFDDGYLASKLTTAGFTNVQSDNPYWTSTPNAFDPLNSAWSVNFANRNVSSSNTGSAFYAWFVR